MSVVVLGACGSDDPRTIDSTTTTSTGPSSTVQPTSDTPEDTIEVPERDPVDAPHGDAMAEGLAWLDAYLGSVLADAYEVEWSPIENRSIVLYESPDLPPPCEGDDFTDFPEGSANHVYVCPDTEELVIDLTAVEADVDDLGEGVLGPLLALAVAPWALAQAGVADGLDPVDLSRSGDCLAGAFDAWVIEQDDAPTTEADAHAAAQLLVNNWGNYGVVPGDETAERLASLTDRAAALVRGYDGGADACTELANDPDSPRTTAVMASDAEDLPYDEIADDIVADALAYLDEVRPDHGVSIVRWDGRSMTCDGETVTDGLLEGRLSISCTDDLVLVLNDEVLAEVSQDAGDMYVSGHAISVAGDLSGDRDRRMGGDDDRHELGACLAGASVEWYETDGTLVLGAGDDDDIASGALSYRGGDNRHLDWIRAYLIGFDDGPAACDDLVS